MSRLNSRFATTDIREDLIEYISFDNPPLRFLIPALTPAKTKSELLTQQPQPQKGQVFHLKKHFL